MQDDLFTRPPIQRATGGGGNDNLFAWTVAILIFVGLALGSWMASFYIFGHPEQAISYSILKKIGKAEPPARFTLANAPRGGFLTAKELFEQFSGLPAFELENDNQRLLRGFVTNYHSAKEDATYAIGTYTVLDSFELTGDDLIAGGVAVLAQATDFPALLVEQLLPCAPEAVPMLQRRFLTGQQFRLKKSYDLSAVIHAEKLGDGRVLLTLAPLLYGRYVMEDGVTFASLDPPADLFLDHRLPTLSKPDIQDADGKLVAFRRRTGQTSTVLSGPATEAASGTQPISSEPPRAVAPPADASGIPAAQPPAPREIPVARAVPVDPNVVIATPTPTPPPTTTPASTPTPEPPVLRAIPVQPGTGASALPIPPLASASPAQLQLPAKPLPAASPSPPPAASSPQWTLYPPGKMPRGKLVAVAEATRYANQSLGGERLYLQGEFVVTAARSGRAVARERAGGLPNPLNRGTAAKSRIIIEFPDPSLVPAEGSSFSRGGLRPFQVTSVREGPDGIVNIYVREVTAAE